MYVWIGCTVHVLIYFILLYKQILERVPIPDDLIPPDSKVEMDAKIAAGYFTNGHVPTESDLHNTVGRGWDSFSSV
jgi:hypothetical protein